MLLKNEMLKKLVMVCSVPMLVIGLAISIMGVMVLMDRLWFLQLTLMSVSNSLGV